MKKTILSIYLFILFLSLTSSNSSIAATSALGIKPWPEAKMPFVIEDNMPSDQRKLILQAIKRINDLQIVKLIEVQDGYDGSVSVFTYKSDNICSSGYGWRDGPNNLIKISKVCSYGNILHEIMHALGFLHEHLNPNRDSIIHMDHATEAYFDQYSFDDAQAVTSYDINSIMHYSSFDNSLCHALDNPKWSDVRALEKPHSSCRNKDWVNQTVENNNGIDCRLECAVITHPQAGFITGQRTDLSELDIQGLKALYSYDQ